ncbi:MAG: hypothetical protein AAGA08_10130 [Pseudomonadota bacterium]
MDVYPGVGLPNAAAARPFHSADAELAPELRLENDPEETARRSLKAAIVCGHPEPPRAISQIATQLPKQHSRSYAGLFALGALGMLSLYLAYQASSKSGADDVAIVVPDAIIAQALNDIAPAVPDDVPVLPELSGPGFEPEKLQLYASAGFDAKVASVLRMGRPADETPVLVFDDVPKQPTRAGPSFVSLPELPTLTTPITVMAEARLPVQATPVFIRAISRPNADKFDRVEAPQIRTELLDQPTEPLTLTAPSDRIVPADTTRVAVAFKATRAAPRRSLRPLAAPANRTVVAQRQIRRAATATTRQDRPTRTVLVQSAAPAFVSAPLERPQLIEPKRSRLQRFFQSLGSD